MAEQAAPVVRTYFGKPENKKDPNAVQAPRKPAKPAPAKTDKPGLPKPATTFTPEHQNVRTGDPFADSIFGRGVAVRETNARTHFSPNLVSLIEISRAVFQQMKTDDVHLTKQLLPEYVDYYHTFCLWARIVHLKSKNQEPLTLEEEHFLDLLQQREYNIADPISIYLRGLGNITTKTGEHLYPVFPPLPKEVVSSKSGFYGNIDVNTHNLYEEVPCLGVLAEGIMYSVSNEPPGPYTSVLSTEAAPVNKNLLGFKSLQSRRSEAKDLAFSHDITSNSFADVDNTAINIGLINAISDILATSKTFKMNKTNFLNLTASGSICQTITTKRVQSGVEPDVQSDIQPSSLTSETVSTYGASIFSTYQLEKSTPYSNWLCVTPPAQNRQANQVDPFEPWRTNRNDRRDLPVQYQQPVFRSTSQNARTFREDVISSLVTSKR